MFPSQVELLYHILDECEYLIKQKQLITLEELIADKTLSHAFCRSIEIIGEAAKKVNNDLKQQHPHIDWKRMSAMRDKIIHNYFGVDLQIIWDTIQNDVPKLEEDIKEVIITLNTKN